MRPMVKGGGGGKAGDHGVDAIEGAEQATLSTRGKRTAMDEAGNYGFGTRLPESFYEDFASILEACEIEEEEETSGGAAAFHTPVLETTATGPRAGARPRETDGGGGKAGNRNGEEEVRSGRRRDPSTPGPETSAVASEHGHKTEEMGGGREDERPGVGACEKTEREARSGIEERVGNRPDRKTSRSVIRPDREAKRHDWRPRCTSRNTRWEPVSARRRPSGRKGYDSVGDREREEPSTPILETSAVADQRKTEEMMGGGEESEANAESGTGADARCGKADERGRNGKPESKEATATKDEETDTEVGSTASGRDEAKHALRPVEGHETSMHTADGRQRVTDDDGRVKPSRGKRGTKDGAARHQDQRHGPSAIGTSGESCLGKRRRCVKNGGLRTGKRKRGVPEDMRGQSGQEGAGRDKAETRATTGTDTEFGEERYLSERVREEERNTKRAIRPHEGQATSTGMMVCSTAREHGRRREGGRCVMGSSKDRSTSTHSEESIDIRGKPTEGNRGAERVGMPRCAARERRSPACNRRDRESTRRLYEADKRRATGSATAFGRTDRGRKRGHRKRRSGCRRWFEETRWTWRIGWRQRLGEHRRVWRIGWSRRFETIRRRWWAGRRRWFVWTGWTCSKWKTKPSKPTRLPRARLAALAENLAFCPLSLAHTGGCAVRWGRMS